MSYGKYLYLQEYLVLLCFTLLGFSAVTFFYKWKVCGSPLGPTLSIAASFQTAFAHFLSLCHVLVILTTFQTLSLLYLLWWSVVIVSGHHELHPYEMANLIDKYVCVLTAPLTGHSPISLFLFRPPISWDIIILKSGQLITLQWLVSVQVKGRVTCHLL